MGLAAFLYNIPRFLEVTWASTYDDDTKENITEVQPTLLRQDPIYIRYLHKSSKIDLRLGLLSVKCALHFDTFGHKIHIGQPCLKLDKKHAISYFICNTGQQYIKKIQFKAIWP